MSPARPAGSETYRKCPYTGCPVMVYGHVLTENPCRDHGGQSAFELNTDEYGIPRQASTGGSPPPPVHRRQLETA